MLSRTQKQLATVTLYVGGGVALALGGWGLAVGAALAAAAVALSYRWQV